MKVNALAAAFDPLAMATRACPTFKAVFNLAKIPTATPIPLNAPIKPSNPTTNDLKMSLLKADLSAPPTTFAKLRITTVALVTTGPIT